MRTKRDCITRRAALTGIVGSVAVVLASCGGPAGGSSPTPVALSTPTPTTAPTPTPAPATTPTQAPKLAGQMILSYDGHLQPVRAAVWSPDGTRIASGDISGKVAIWEPGSGKELLVYQAQQGGGVSALDWAPGGQYLVSGSSYGMTGQASDFSVKVWDPNTGKLVVKYAKHTNAITAVAWSPDGTRIASASIDQTVQVWEAMTGKNLVTYKVNNGAQAALDWSPDSKYIVSSSNTDAAGPSIVRDVKIWDSQSGKVILSYPKGNLGAFALAWSHDGKFIASDSGNIIHIWSATTGQDAHSYQLTGDSMGFVLSAAWSPNDNYIALSSGSMQAVDPAPVVEIKEVATGRTVVCHGHSDSIWTVAWSPDGTRVVSASNDKTVRVWQAV